MAAQARPSRREQQGFSILEVMIALFISMMMLAAVITVFVNTRHNFRYQQGINALNDNIRHAVRTLSYDIRMAGHWGGASRGPRSTDDSVDATTITVVNACIGFSPHLSDMVNNNRDMYPISIIGRSALPSADAIDADGISQCLNFNTLVTETDVLSVFYAKPEVITDADLPDTATDGQYFQRTRVGFAPSVFLSEANLSSYGAGHELSTANGGINLLLVAASYAVSQCDSLTVVCTSGERKLLRVSNRELGGNINEQEIVAAGVEAMSFMMLVDLNRDGSNIRYLNAPDLLAAAGLGDNPFAAARAVSMSLVVRSDVRDIAFSDTTTYSMPGPDYDPATAVEDFPRRLVTSTVYLRNNDQR